MKQAVSLTLALRFLGVGSGKSVSNARKSLYGAIAGIGISLVPLITVLVVSDGMISGISERLIELSTSHIRVTDNSGMADGIGSLQSLADGILENDLTGRIVYSQPERQGLALAVGKKGRGGATVRAVNPSYFTASGNPSWLFTVPEGVLALDSPDAALIGEKLASDIGVHAGDRFRILTMNVGTDGRTIPKFSTFVVRGIISSGYQELDALWVFIPLARGFSILSDDSSSTFVNVRTTDAQYGLDAVKYSLRRSLPEGLTVRTWSELNRGQLQSLNTTRTLLVFIMVLIVLIASVNVSSALVMLVMERRQEIAIMKSVGADPGGIAFAFILAGFLTGLGGVAVGMPLGILCAVNINGLFSAAETALNAIAFFSRALTGSAGKGDILAQRITLLDPAYYLQSIPVRLDALELVTIAVGTLCLSVLVSVLPAVRAGSERPVDTMRKY
jgi:lipoprotein-releasing system permease protein